MGLLIFMELLLEYQGQILKRQKLKEPEKSKSAVNTPMAVNVERYEERLKRDGEYEVPSTIRLFLAIYGLLGSAFLCQGQESSLSENMPPTEGRALWVKVKKKNIENLGGGGEGG